MGNDRSTGRVATKKFVLNKKHSRTLYEFATESLVTLNTLIEALWALILARWLGKRRVTFGTGVSGRSINLPDIANMCGMFSNILPLCISIDPDKSLKKWLAELQVLNSERRNYEVASLEDIAEWTGQNPAATNFDSLLAIENMPMDSLSGGGITINRFESGFTSSFPLAVAIRPLGQIEVLFKYDASELSERAVDWFGSAFKKLADILAADKGNISVIMEALSTPPVSQRSDPGDGSNRNINGFVPPQNQLELELTEIFEELFEAGPVSVLDDFFSMGGTSILALRLFAEIEKRFERKLPLVPEEKSTVAAAALLAHSSKPIIVIGFMIDGLLVSCPRGLLWWLIFKLSPFRANFCAFACIMLHRPSTDCPALVCRCTEIY